MRRIDRKPFSHGRRTTSPAVGERVERQLGEILAVGVAVERRIEVGAGVGDHVDPADLEARALVVIGRRAPRVQKSQMCGAGRPL